MAPLATGETSLSCCSQWFSEKIPGDYAEVGVWRGGTGILARGILNELERHGSRTVHLFDAFDVKVSKYESGHRDLFAQNPTTGRH